MKKICILLTICLLAFLPMVEVKAADSEEYEVTAYDPDNFQSFNAFYINPEDEQIAFDSAGRVTEGVCYVGLTYGSGYRKYIYKITDDSEGFLFIYPRTNNGVVTWYVGVADASGKTLSNTTARFNSYVRYSGNMSFSYDVMKPLLDENCTLKEDDCTFNIQTYSGVAEAMYDEKAGSGYVSSTYLSNDNWAFYTNIPIFYDLESAAFKSYVESGDYSGASNAADIDAAQGGSSEKWDNNDLWLDMQRYDGTNLTVRPSSNASCTWTYFPHYTSDYTDIKLTGVISYQCSVQFGNSNSVGGTMYKTKEFSLSLSDCKNSLTIYPVRYALDSNLIEDAVVAECLLGGSMQASIGAAYFGSANVSYDLYNVTGSYMTVTFHLAGKLKGDNYVYGPAYTERVDLLTRECEEITAYSDDEGNYTNESTSKVTDANGNVTIKVNNDVSGGGSSGGGSSSATGGSSSSTAEGGTSSSSAKVGDITNNNTFTFPDKIQIDLNVKGIEGSASGSTSSGSDSDSDKSWWDKLLDAVSSFLNFLAGVVTNLFTTIGNLIETFADGVSDFILYIFEGFGLFSKDGGMSDLLQENLSFLPSEVWQLVMFGLSSAILVAIIRRFWK